MSISPKTKEPQYSVVFDVREKHGITHLGLMANEFLESGSQAHVVYAGAL